MKDAAYIQYITVPALDLPASPNKYTNGHYLLPLKSL
jgi:hypothetical protein